jgi:uncharacterized protein YdhG (YjbR/CyaY superfamily)
MTVKPTTIDEYLARVVPEQRAALKRLRKAIHAAAPQAEECISYGLPAFRLNGRVLVYFGAAARHCSFFPGSGTTVATHAHLLKNYQTSKGTIRFRPARPIPAALVRILIKSRIEEINAALEKSRPKAKTSVKRDDYNAASLDDPPRARQQSSSKEAVKGKERWQRNPKSNSTSRQPKRNQPQATSRTKPRDSRTRNGPR